MIKIFTSYSSLGSRQAIKFFKENELEFIEKNVSVEQMTKQELIDVLSLSESGFEDILSERSSAFKKIKENFEDKSFDEAVRLITENSECLSRPIIIQYRNNIPFRLQIGYSNEDIEIFLRKD